MVLNREIKIMEKRDTIETALRERVKELNCLYGMAQLAERYHDSMEDFLKHLADFLPSSWFYPDVACARIVFREQVFESKNFRMSEWQQSAQIRVGDDSAGNIITGYIEERPEADEGPFLKEERRLLKEVAQRIGEVAVLIAVEQELQENNKQLLLERMALQESNVALRVVLANIEDEKKRIYESIQSNIEKIVMPILHALTPAVAKNKQKYIEIIKRNLEEITLPYVNRTLKYYQSLTPTEVNICNMIRNGLRTKEIAQLRGVSAATINRHREHIRSKLKINNQRINLTTYLQEGVANFV